MNDTWKKFLSDAGAVFNENGARDFGNPAAERQAALEGGIVCDLSHRGLIAVAGEDALSFLQGQLSCDLGEVSERSSRLGAWCSPKGRVLTLFRVIRLGDGMLLELPASRLADSVKRLSMYVLRARVSLKDVSGDFVRVGVTGQAAPVVLETTFGGAPAWPDEVAPACAGRLVRLHGSLPRYQFIGGLNDAMDLWRAAAEALTPAGAGAWALTEILAGVPEVTESDQHLPQMINLDRLNGVNFHKGCFVGQEVIARTHHLGRLKRRMYLVRVDGSADETPGTRIVEVNGGSDAAGELLSSATHPDGSARALAVLRIDAAGKRANLRLGGADGPAVTVLDQPYSLHDDVR